jgi:hypothetical protein
MAVRTIQVNLSADISNFQQNISRAERSIGSLGSELNNNMRRISANTQLMLSQLGNNANGMDTMRVRANGLGQSLQQQSTYVNRLQSELTTASSRFGSTSTQVRNLELQLLRAATAEQTMRNELARLNAELGTNARLRRAGESMQGLQGAGMGMTAGITLPLVLAGKAAFNASKDAQEAVNLYKISFGEMTNVVDDWSKTMNNKYKLNETNLKKYAGNFNLILQNMGFDAKQSSKISTDLVSRAIDISSLRNVSFEKVYEKIRSGLTGESEPLMQLGINVKVEKLKKFAADKGLIEKGQELNETGKAYAAYLSILAQTTKDEGDFGRTINGSANQIRIFQEQLQTFSETIGTKLTSAYERFAQVINPLLERFNSLTPRVQSNILLFGALAASLGPVLIGISLMGRILIIASDGALMLSGGLTRAITAVRGITVASLAANVRLAALASSVLIVAASAFIIYDNWSVMPSWFAALWDNIKAGFVAAKDIMLTIMNQLKFGVVAAMSWVNEKVKGTLASLLDSMSQIPVAGEKFLGVGDKIRASGNPFDSWVISANKDVENSLARMDISSANVHEAALKFEGITSKIASGYSLDKIKEKFDGLGDGIKDSLGGIGDITGLSDIAEDAKSKGKKLEDVIKEMVDKVKSQAVSFRDALGLFDKATTEKLSGETMLARLKGQMNILKGWQSALLNLKNRLGENSSLYQDLLQRGPQAAGQIVGLSKSKDSLLSDYNSLFRQKSALAGDMAAGAVKGQMLQEKKVENIVIQITNAYGDGVNKMAEDIMNIIVEKLNMSGVH